MRERNADSEVHLGVNIFAFLGTSPRNNPSLTRPSGRGNMLSWEYFILRDASQSLTLTQEREVLIVN